jgi:indolepyruvate ferredoxin oxidoreductase
MAACWWRWATTTRANPPPPATSPTGRWSTRTCPGAQPRGRAGNPRLRSLWLALSRFAGVWVGLKLMKDTVEATAVVDGRPDRMQFTYPEFEMPEGGLNIRLGDHWIAQEERLLATSASRRRPSPCQRHRPAHAWQARREDRLRRGGQELARPRVWALAALGIDGAEAERLGITTYKVGQTWPLDMKGLPGLGRGAGADRRRGGKAQADRGAGQGGDLRRPPRPPRLRLQGRAGRVLFPQHFALDPRKSRRSSAAS